MVNSFLVIYLVGFDIRVMLVSLKKVRKFPMTIFPGRDSGKLVEFLP